MKYELSVDQLKRTFDPKTLGIDSTEKFKKLNTIIGQKRAVSALRFGLQIEGNGYNIYVAGPPGTGKMTSVQSFLEEMADSKETPPDLCYVNNFNDPYTPKAIELPAGLGCEFQQDMDELVDKVRRELPKAFESDEYSSRGEDMLENLDRQRNEISQEINKKAAENGFKLQATPMGIMIMPVKNGEPLKEEEFQSLPEEEKNEVEKKRQELQNEMKSAMKKIRNLERKSQEKVRELDRQVVLNIVGGPIEDLIEKYEDYSDVIEYLKQAQRDIVDNIENFKTRQQQQQNARGAMNPQEQIARDMMFRKYKVNVLVNNADQKGAPVVVELNPSHNNLFGRIEKEMMLGALNTDFTMIKAGSMLRANGGFLVLRAEDVIRDMFSYDGIKRALRSSELQIEELGERLGFMATKSLRPQPVPLNLKVVLVGEPYLYQLLHAYDEEFPELFKTKAEFDTRMDINDENINNFISFISTYCEKKDLRHLDNKAAAKVMEYASRLAEDQKKLSTKFGQLSDVLCEADYWAKNNDSDLITEKHVKQAIDEKMYRSNLIEERIREMIDDGTILIDTGDEVSGQVNGLAVIDIGNYQFGKPNRITATVGPGKEGIIDIEREVKLGGPIHSKGVLILSGYLSNKYAESKPLSLAARLVFEQSYQGVEGDSASVAELFAILSALSGTPIKQGIAVTGSLNQKGEMQSIGGVHQKIEGFYQVCKLDGMNGQQGVIIPKSNVQNLTLRDEVIHAVKEKQFHIWGIQSIDEGMEILTGADAGERKSDGKFTEDSVNERIRQRLLSFETTLKELAEKK